MHCESAFIVKAHCILVFPLVYPFIGRIKNYTYSSIMILRIFRIEFSKNIAKFDLFVIRNRYIDVSISCFVSLQKWRPKVYNNSINDTQISFELLNNDR